MGKKQKIIMQLGKVVIAGVVSLFLCSAFVLVEKYTGIHVVNESGATDYKWQPYQWRAYMEEGFSWFRMDENGFNNAYERKSENVDILLMGSSHMEAIQVGAKENAGYLLNEMLPEYTYNIGISAHSIYTCTRNMMAAINEYQPTEYVIVETSTVELSETDMQDVVDGTYKTIPSYDSGLLYILQKTIPIMKNVYKQLIFWKSVSGGTLREA
jgi:hypothetical protein